MPTKSFSSFFSSTTITVPASGLVNRVDKSGSYFFCKEAGSRFLMRFNGGEWFEFDQSFAFNLADDYYTYLEFKCLAGATKDIDVLFYTASREVTASLNVIRNPYNFQSSQYLVAPTLVKGWSGSSLTAGQALLFYGTGGLTMAGVLYSYRKGIIVTNNDSSSVIEIWNSDQTRRVGTVQPLKAWYLETSDDLVVKNETLSTINCRISEIFYPASIVQATPNPTGTPVLVFSSDLNWSWTGSNPAGWRIEKSADGLTGWSEVVILAGFSNVWTSGTQAEFYRVIAVDAEDNPVTAYSNVVQWTGTPVASYATGTMSWTYAGGQPISWRIEESPDGSTGWTEKTTVPGATVSYTGGTATKYYRVVAIDSTDTAITPFSNVIGPW